MRLVGAGLALLLLSACAASKAPVSSQFLGQHIDSVTALYGPWAEVVTLEGRPMYIWRRNTTIADANYYCELWIETGYRKAVSKRVMQGYPAACRQFQVRYVSAGMTRPMESRVTEIAN